MLVAFLSHTPVPLESVGMEVGWVPFLLSMAASPQPLSFTLGMSRHYEMEVKNMSPTTWAQTLAPPLTSPGTSGKSFLLLCFCFLICKSQNRACLVGCNEG